MTEGNGTQQPPQGLQPEGIKLWQAVTVDYELDQHELALLLAAGRTVDRLEDIAEALHGAPLTVENKRGDMIVQPLLVEQRQQSLVLARLVASLRLPSGETEEGELIRPQRRGAARGSYGIRGIAR
jgi:hypothetical protein